MRPGQRIVTQTPLSELWDAGGVLPLERGSAVGRDQIAEFLRGGRVRFVLADPGLPLTWVPLDECYSFWKGEVKPHLVEPNAWGQVRLEDWPGEYCYHGTVWGGSDKEVVVLLEKLH